MKSKRNLLIAGTVVAVCLVAAQIAISIPDRHFDTGRDGHYDTGGNYQVTPEVTTPEYITDTARVIDAYERLMERYIDLAEYQQGDCRDITEKLASIDSRLNEISARLSRIEKAIGIDPNGNGRQKRK